jgi:hypothetical protein
MLALKKLQACGEFTLVYEAVKKGVSRRKRLVVMIRDERPGSHWKLTYARQSRTQGGGSQR